MAGLAVVQFRGPQKLDDRKGERRQELRAYRLSMQASKRCLQRLSRVIEGVRFLPLVFQNKKGFPLLTCKFWSRHENHKKKVGEIKSCYIK